MENHHTIINWPPDATRQQKEWIIESMKRRAKEKMMLCVIYHPNCGCSLDQFVLLDRPLTDEDFTLEELKQMHVTNTDQAHYIKLYQKS